MKLISMLGLATFLLGTEAKCKDLHRHVRLVLQPYNEDGCVHKDFSDGKKMKQDHCESFEPSRSMNLQYKGNRHHDYLPADLSICNIVIYDEGKCHGSNMTIPLNEAFSGCTNFTFTDAAGGVPRHSGHSAKWHCAAAAKVDKGKETVTVTSSAPIVVDPTPPASIVTVTPTVPVVDPTPPVSIVTVTPAVPVITITETRKSTKSSKPSKAPASTSTVVVAPDPTTMTLTETSTAGTTSRTFTYTFVTTATASWETRAV